MATFRLRHAIPAKLTSPRLTNVRLPGSGTEDMPVVVVTSLNAAQYSFGPKSSKVSIVKLNKPLLVIEMSAFEGRAAPNDANSSFDATVWSKR